MLLVPREVRAEESVGSSPSLLMSDRWSAHGRVGLATRFVAQVLLSVDKVLGSVEVR